MLKPHDRIFIRLNTTPECNGRTDRQTDRQTDGIPLASKDRPKVEISVSAETESHAESGIQLSAETKITPKETTRFRPKSETETESACDLSLYPRVRMWT